MWEAPTESRNPNPWGTRGNKDQTENHSTKCDTKKKTEETEKNRKETREKERKETEMGKKRQRQNSPGPLIKSRDTVGGQEQAASL